jgi:hypothetical protein
MAWRSIKQTRAPVHKECHEAGQVARGGRNPLAGDGIFVGECGMAKASEFERLCRACGSANDANADHCAACGAELDAAAKPSEIRFADEDPALTHVGPDHRVELTRFETERGDEADLACGLLRANGIACELSSTALPGLPADLIIWVNAQDARPAWALLEDAQREASKEKEEDDAA